MSLLNVIEKKGMVLLSWKLYIYIPIASMLEKLISMFFIRLLGGSSWILAAEPFRLFLKISISRLSGVTKTIRIDIE